MIECGRCGSKISDAESTTVQPLECPTCGYIIAPPPRVSRGSLSLVTNYFKDVWQIITHPAGFFRHMPIHGGMTRPLVFALVTHWLGAALGFVWSLLLGGTLSQLITRFFALLSDSTPEIDYSGRHVHLSQFRDQIKGWFLGVGPVILDPFLTLASIFFTAFLVYVGARILVSPGKDGHPQEVTLESAVRIICFGMSPAILSAVPIFGGLISSLGVMIVTIIGAREVYRIEIGRAIVVALFPKLLFVGIMGMGLLFFAVALIKLAASVL